MLKPTVGIELETGQSPFRIVDAKTGQLLARLHILDRKLASLEHNISLKHRRRRLHPTGPDKKLTARTRNSEVLPAFWRPIMVMSISVALHDGDHQHGTIPEVMTVIAATLQAFKTCGELQHRGH
ncbi:hypothetical protein Tdes44962_MAKER02786 [Teratosphaeria destructans]|uniref:Uncharacterized protein n=1 Tax=Teratosphaeria destructans TaxID=418781 RepID=A0A9W7W254_9PEZI|nr:hypothetical protein Tdes44962_MAKER02786 [Teratosphaeria destructans]